MLLIFVIPLFETSKSPSCVWAELFEVSNSLSRITDGLSDVSESLSEVSGELSEVSKSLSEVSGELSDVSEAAACPHLAALLVHKAYPELLVGFCVRTEGKSCTM